MAAWLTQAEAAKHLRLGIRTFRKRVAEGALPKGHQASDRRKVWTAEELDAAVRGINDAAGPSDPIMAAINAANAKAAALRGAQSR
ncbi:MAG: hypothetical protein JSR78_10545 [Proteobacteria bacterium]|nr:hypothetical protein [Pseudomonadota bacterium]